MKQFKAFSVFLVIFSTQVEYFMNPVYASPIISHLENSVMKFDRNLNTTFHFRIESLKDRTMVELDRKFNAVITEALNNYSKLITDAGIDGIEKKFPTSIQQIQRAKLKALELKLECFTNVTSEYKNIIDFSGQKCYSKRLKVPIHECFGIKTTNKLKLMVQKYKREVDFNKEQKDLLVLSLDCCINNLKEEFHRVAIDGSNKMNDFINKQKSENHPENCTFKHPIPVKAVPRLG